MRHRSRDRRDHQLDNSLELPRCTYLTSLSYWCAHALCQKLRRRSRTRPRRNHQSCQKNTRRRQILIIHPWKNKKKSQIPTINNLILSLPYSRHMPELILLDQTLVNQIIDVNVGWDTVLTGYTLFWGRKVPASVSLPPPRQLGHFLGVQPDRYESYRYCLLSRSHVPFRILAVHVLNTTNSLDIVKNLLLLPLPLLDHELPEPKEAVMHSFGGHF